MPHSAQNYARSASGLRKRKLIFLSWFPKLSKRVYLLAWNSQISLGKLGYARMN